jgi:ABC-type sugar transport system ATPase subunit
VRADGGSAVAVLPGLDVPLPGHAAAEEVTIGLRPERIAVSRERRPDALAATIERVDFAGPLASLTCRLADGTAVAVTTWGAEAPTFRPEQPVWLTPHPEAVRTFDGDPLADEEAPRAAAG